MMDPGDARPLNGVDDEGLPQLGGDALAEFEAAPLAMILLRPDGRIWKVNHAYLDLLGWILEDVDGVPLPDLVPDSQRRFVARRLATALETEGALPEVRTVVATATGGRVAVMSSSMAVRDGAGVPQYIVIRMIRTDL
jgi:PAS domain S-box-containing protein